MDGPGVPDAVHAGPGLAWTKHPYKARCPGRISSRMSRQNLAKEQWNQVNLAKNSGFLDKRVDFCTKSGILAEGYI